MNKAVRPTVQILLLACLLIICSGISKEIRSDRAGKSEVILGVLEDRPGHFAGEQNAWRVRIVLEKTGNKWQAFSKPLPDEVSWTIAFDGRRLGDLKTGSKPDVIDSYADVGYQAITSTAPVPKVGERNLKYAGWLGEPAYRPLVAVSKPNFADPESWKRTKLPEELASRLRQEFRKKFPKVMNCSPRDYEHLIRWPYSEKDIRIRDAYNSRTNWYAVKLHLSEYNCDGPDDDDSPFGSQWFIVDPTGMIKHLGYGMWLVDAGDYDADGKSEILFAVDGYNRGGYRLFYADFTESAEFIYSFH